MDKVLYPESPGKKKLSANFGWAARNMGYECRYGLR